MKTRTGGPALQKRSQVASAEHDRAILRVLQRNSLAWNTIHDVPLSSMQRLGNFVINSREH